MAAEPQIGIGVLLLREDGRFLLTERTRDPGLGKLGTVGGPLRAHRSVPDELRFLAKQELDIDASQMRIGSLLACTNMTADSKHFVDLTFAALLAGDAEPRIVDDNHAYVVDPNGKPLMWYTFDEVARLHRYGRLFLPVANAFERYAELVGDKGTEPDLSLFFTVDSVAESIPSDAHARPRASVRAASAAAFFETASA